MHLSLRLWLRQGEIPLLTTWPSWLHGLPAFCVGVEEQRVHTYANYCSGIGLCALGPVVTEYRECLYED